MSESLTIGGIRGMTDGGSRRRQRRSAQSDQSVSAAAACRGVKFASYLRDSLRGSFFWIDVAMDRFTGRRKLIRGSLSAPLVLTVASPAALARQSFEACVDRASKAMPQDLEPFSASHDTFVRKLVTVYEGTLNSESSPELFHRETDEVKQNHVYFKVTDCLRSTGYRREHFKPGLGPKRVTRYALVHVNDKGEPVSVGYCSASTGAFPVTGSCWASFGGMIEPAARIARPRVLPGL